jgi:hypothetical protein
VVAADHAALPEEPRAFEAGRRRDADLAGDVLVGLPRVQLQLPDDRRIHFVHDRIVPGAAE